MLHETKRSIEFASETNFFSGHWLLYLHKKRLKYYNNIIS